MQVNCDAIGNAKQRTKLHPLFLAPKCKHWASKQLLAKLRRVIHRDTSLLTNQLFVVSFRLVKSLQTLKQNIFRPGRSNRIFLVSRLQLRHGSLRSRKCPPASESTWRQTHRRDSQRRWNHSSQRSASVYTRRTVSFSVDLSRVNVQCPQNKLTLCRTTKLWRTITSRLFASHYRKKCSQILINLVIKIPAIFIASALVVRCLISSQVHVFPLTQTAADKRLAIISACKLF